MKIYDSALLDGELSTLAGEREVALDDPHKGVPDRNARHGDESDIDRAVQSARAAFGSWSKTSTEERREVLTGLAATIEARACDLAEAVVAEVGTPEKIARAVQAGLPVRVLRGFAQDVEAALAPGTIDNSTVTHRPVGVVAALTPWNYPLHQAIAKVGGALAAGCTVVLKPSELTPRTNQLLMEILAERVPAGTVNVVPGDAETGAALVAHAGIDAISFTGSVEGGRKVAEAAARLLKPCFLELGGKSAGIVLDDADMGSALKAIVNVGLLNSGQTCNALTRILVPAARFDEATAEVGALADRMGPRLGPTISAAQFERVQGFISRALEDDSVTCITGGLGRPDDRADGYYVRPTVFATRNPKAEIVRNEVFGPVLVVQPYEDDDDLVALANGTDYGIAAAVWGEDAGRVDRIASRLRAGQIDVNGGAFNPRAPFGGFGSSGSGREMGLHGIREFQAPVSVQR